MARPLRWFFRLRKRERVLVLLALAALAVYLVAALLLVPGISGYRSNGELIAQNESVLEGYRETLEKEKLLKRKIEALQRAAGAFGQYMLKSTKPALAAAELQNRLKESAATHGLEITSEKIANASRGSLFTSIPVEISAKGDILAIMNFLYDVETGLPLLSIDELNVRTAKRRTFDPATRKYVDLEELQATIRVAGMMQRD